MKSNPKKALDKFIECIQLEEALGDEVQYRFKATQCVIVICCRLGEASKAQEYHQKLLKNLDKVARNDVSDAINDVLDAVAKHLSQDQTMQRKLYEMTLTVLHNQNYQLWFQISLRLGKIFQDQGMTNELNDLIASLKKSCRKDDSGDQIMSSGNNDKDFGEYDQSKSNLLLETFALEI